MQACSRGNSRGRLLSVDERRELDFGARQAHERLLERGLLRRQLVNRDPVSCGGVADLLRGEPVYLEGASVTARQGDAGASSCERSRSCSGERTSTTFAEARATNPLTLVSAISLPRPITIR